MSSSSETLYWLHWTDECWKKWLIERLQERENVFGSDPDELIASYKREKSHASGYKGRELLELIQNADDAGNGYLKPNEMLIQLSPNAIYVANTGIPFSPEGIKSIMLGDISPKQLQKGLIGYKGLGFRSVLGWSSSIVIMSGKLSIGFSERKAIEWLKTLKQKNENVKKKIEEFESRGMYNPIATLSVPYIFDSINSKEMMSPEIFDTLSLIHQKGYDTVICLVFDKSTETYEKVKRQIENIIPEILLFLQHLQSLKIITPEMEKCWEVRREEHNVIINPDNVKPQVWKIFSESGEIPKECRRPEQPLMSRYEIKLAFLPNSLERHPLFVYFPTAVLFPYPLVAHATFELTDNREHLIESDINKFIAKKLAKFIADSAEKLVDPENPWNALMSVTPCGDLDPVLERLGFEESLKSEIASRKIIPVRCKQFDCAKNVKWINGDFNDLLIGEEFKDICLYTENKYLKERLFDIGVETIQYDDLKERLDKLSRTAISMDTRAEIIYRLIENGIVREGLPPPELLIDENGSPIPAGRKAWLPPEGKKFSLPEWVPQRIVNSELATLLKDKFGLTRVRDLVSKLRAFEVQEYSMATLVSTIVAETNRQVREDPKNELKFRQKMLQAIWSLYSAQKSEEKPPALPEAINITLPARDGSFQPSNTLYIGKDYPEGALLEYLYGALGGPFVANFADLGLEGDINEIKSFLCWLGVADLPRIVKIKKGGAILLIMFWKVFNILLSSTTLLLTIRTKWIGCTQELKT